MKGLSKGRYDETFAGEDGHLSATSHINCIIARCLINVVYLTVHVCTFIRR